LIRSWISLLIWPGLALQAADPLEQLRKLGELRDAGVLSEEEFAAKKADILSRM